MVCVGTLGGDSFGGFWGLAIRMVRRGGCWVPGLNRVWRREDGGDPVVILAGLNPHRGPKFVVAADLVAADLKKNAKKSSRLSGLHKKLFKGPTGSGRGEKGRHPDPPTIRQILRPPQLCFFLPTILRYCRGMEKSQFLERLTKKNYEETKSASGVAESKGFSLERFCSGVDNPIGCYHAAIQELIVIDDLLSALVGIEGRYISIRRVHGKDDSANFPVDTSMDQLMMGSMKALYILIKKASAANFIGSAVLNLLQSQAKAIAKDHVVRSLLEKMSQSANQAYLGILERSKSDDIDYCAGITVAYSAPGKTWMLEGG
ncbi:gamma-tubulin complex component 2 [Phtheirospermum japonicum]|uniref:Gamma-tubulin complex component 2 n=1 Tax=Phtheirospermum japonicum TaxID=374723 RepID=A0A830C800_9LAMI|nr:gamma-tubulin complex component 2 [Phtheirospermum japonicum]